MRMQEEFHAKRISPALIRCDLPRAAIHARPHSPWSFPFFANFAHSQLQAPETISLNETHFTHAERRAACPSKRAPQEQERPVPRKTFE